MSSSTYYPGRFEDRVAIVTGAAQGIGQATALRLAAEGASVALADINDGPLQTSANDAKAVGGGDVLSFVGDLSRHGEAERLVSDTQSRFGKIDILINNAGGGVIRSTLEHDIDSITTTLERNLWTTIHCTRAVLPCLVERGYGRIVNLGAESVRNGFYQHALYNAAKGGVHGLTTGIAREFAPKGIVVNTLAPGATVTDELKVHLQDAAFQAMAEQLRGMIPLGRFNEVTEVVAAITFLASEEAGAITGQVISVNGGSSML